MAFSGAIFDFNGTLFLDSVFHEQAWKELSAQLRGTPFTTEEYYEKINGKENSFIIRYLLGEDTPEDKIKAIALEKEAYYRKLCLARPEKLHFTPGATGLFDWLMLRDIPFAIASASEETNIRFYWEQFRLERWFTPDRVIYSNGTFEPKPAPDIYLLAARRLKLAPKEIAVFEDSYSGICSAHAAGSGFITAITAGQPSLIGEELVNAVVKDFREVKPESLFG